MGGGRALALGECGEGPKLPPRFAAHSEFTLRSVLVGEIIYAPPPLPFLAKRHFAGLGWGCIF